MNDFLENKDTAIMRGIWAKFGKDGWLKSPLTAEELHVMAKAIIYLNGSEQDTETMKNLYRTKLCADGTQWLPLSEKEIRCLYNVRETMRKKAMDGEFQSRKESNEDRAKEWQTYNDSRRRTAEGDENE